MVEITSEKQNEVKRMKRIKDSLRDLWDNTKCTNIRIIGVPEEEKKKGYEKIFEEIIVENFPNMEKEIVNQVQETQRVPYKINPRRNIRQTLTDIKGEIDSNTIIVGDFNIPLTPMDRSSKQKINKETQVLNDTLDETDLIDIFKT